MAKSTLIIYQPIESFGDESSYWREYAGFYEKYWGGPTSPFGVWFGNEYGAFRKALSTNLEIEEEDIKDCFFMKDKEENYHVAPFGSSVNLLYSENYIPFYWFLLFNHKERQILFSHWGFNAIHYDTQISNSLERLDEADKVLQETLRKQRQSQKKSFLSSKLTEIESGVKNLHQSLSGYDPSGYIVLNYGEICSFIHPYTLNNENSVGEIWDILALLTEDRIEKAETSLKILLSKWDDIRRKASGEVDSRTLQ